MLNGPAFRRVPLTTQTLLVIDVEACQQSGSAVVWEVPDDSDSPFPHIYGPVPADAVIATRRLYRDSQGVVAMPDQEGLEVLDQPRNAPADLPLTSR